MAKLKVKTLEDKLKEAWEAFRVERNKRLSETDWIVIKYQELGQPIPKEWAEYRQKLRDLPNLVTDEEVLNSTVKWPEPPKSK
jgi:hypothetical protein